MRQKAPLIQEILNRLSDYELQEFVAARRKLIEKWKINHPEAIKEQSQIIGKLEKINEYIDDFGDKVESWVNDVYSITCRRGLKDTVFKTDEGITKIGIASYDGTARHDWREMQQIKNQLVGETVEGFELFPSEDRLLDPSNYYIIWCFPGLKKIHVGVDERRIFDSLEAWAPQRKLP